MARSVARYRRSFLGVWALPLLAYSSGTAWSGTARQLRIGAQFGLGYLPLYIEEETGFSAKRIRAEGPDSIPVEFSHFGRRVVSQRRSIEREP